RPVARGRELVARGHRRLLQDLHARGLPRGALRAADPPPPVPVPPVDVRHRRQREGRLRPGEPPAAAAADHGRRRGLPRGAGRLRRAHRPELLGATEVSTATHDTRREAPAKPTTTVGKAADYLDQRTSIGVAVKEFARKVFPDHWSFMLGEIALFSFVVLIISGFFLTMFFEPSMALTRYEGEHPASMHGELMSVAFASTLDMSFE